MLLLLYYKDVSLMCAYNIQMNMVILITYSADGLKI